MPSQHRPTHTTSPSKMDSLNLELSPKPYDANCGFGYDVSYENNS